MSCEGSGWVFTDKLYNYDGMWCDESHRVGAGGGSAGDISAEVAAEETRSGFSPVSPDLPDLPDRTHYLWRSPTR